MHQLKLQMARRSTLRPLALPIIRLAIVIVGLVIIARLYPGYLQAASRSRFPDVMLMWSGMAATGVVTGLLLELVPLRPLRVAWLPLLAVVAVLGFLLYAASPHGFFYARTQPFNLSIARNIVENTWASPMLSVLLGVLAGKAITGKA